MAEIRINATGGVKLYDADDSHYAQIVAGTITSNVDAITLGHDVVSIVDNLALTSDSAVLKFGADNDTTLTHTDGTGLTLNSTNKLCFNDASQFVQGSSATVLSIGATDEIDLTATAIDINGTCDISGTFSLGGTNMTATATELNLLDGGTSVGSSITIADADGFVVNDGGTMKTIPATDITTYVGGDNTPAFSAVIAADQSISAATWTKVVFGTEDLDSDGKFASNAFTPTVAGWYWCHTSQYYELSDAGEANRVKFYKNGSGLAMHGTVMRSADTDQDMILEANALIYLDGDDYLEVFINSADGVTLASTNSHVFSAFRMTGV